MSPTYTLYQGTFIQLPRQLRQETKPCLEINTGVLWVSNHDGRIQGFDWGVTLDSDSEDDDEDEREKGLVVFVQRKGWTVWRDDDDDDVSVDAIEGEETVRIVRGGRKGRNSFFFPGFIDTHIHASQYPNAGIFGSSTLLDWLKKYTFPMEKSFESANSEKVAPPQAYTVYNKVISPAIRAKFDA